MKRLLILAAAFAAVAPAYADIAFDNFGSGDSDQGFSGKIISGPSSSFGLDTDGYEFTSATTGVVSSIVVGGYNFSGGTMSADFTLYSDAGDTLGSALGSVTGVALANFSPTVLTLTPSSNISLASGSKYWLVEDTSGDGAQVWSYSGAGIGTAYQLTGSGTQYFSVATQGAFRIETQSVPEPMTLFVLPALAILARRRKK